MSLDEDVLKIDEGVARRFRDLSILRRYGQQPIRIARDSEGGGSFQFSCGDRYDENDDYLVERCGARFVVTKELGDEIRGWQFIGHESLYSDFSYHFLPAGIVSTASDPGMLTLDRELLLALEPELTGLRGYWLRVRDRRHRQSKYLGSFDAVTDQLWRGDTRAAIVLTASPSVLIAAYSDDFDAIVVLEFPAAFAAKFALEPGTMLVACNTFTRGAESIANDITPGPKYHTTLTDFHPIIGQFLSRDTNRLQQLLANITSSERERVRQLAEEWLVRFQHGQARPRRGVALWPADMAGRLQRIRGSLNRRVLATVFDLTLMTCASFLMWFLLGLGDEIVAFWRSPKDPAVRAAFGEHKETFRNVASVVYFGYATLMLLTPWQATLGKRMLGLQVVSRSTFGRVSLLKALRRALLFLVSGFSGMLGCLAMLWSRSGQTWHDDRSDTFVIHNRTRSRFSDMLVALSMVGLCALMVCGVVWRFEIIGANVPVARPANLPGNPLPKQIEPLPPVLSADGELLAEFVSLTELSVKIRPPREFLPATEFVGFQHAATRSTIEVSVVNAPFDEVMGTFDPARRREAGWTFRGSRSSSVFGRSTGQVQFEQLTADGSLVTWVFVLGGNKQCALATASAPKNREGELTPFLQSSVQTLSWVPQN